jgi:Tol biopolymer transport system component
MSIRRNAHEPAPRFADMNTSAKLALAAAVVGVAVVGIFLLRACGEVGQSSPPSSQALVPSPTARANSPAVVPPSSNASPAATHGGERIGASPPALGPAGNGLIAFSSDGDIFVGDPVTGTSTAIVTGSTNDTRPTFSPDGKRIAFLRAESERDATVVVVRADGSDERVVMAEGFTQGFPGFAWTPDSTSILLNHDRHGTPYFDGELSLVDASGVAEPRLITPPLPAAIGYTYFSIHDPVAPMVRPPNGDQILSLVGVVDGVISVVDIDGTKIEGFVPPSLTEFEPYLIDRLAWSRDGSMIAFLLYSVTVSGGAGSVIGILDIETGAEGVLEAASAVVKDMANRETDPDAFRTYSIRTEHRYAYEGWSWTPDGRSIVVLERHGTRPFSVDIETGHVTELPWEADSAPSWQRVPIK